MPSQVFIKLTSRVALISWICWTKMDLSPNPLPNASSIRTRAEREVCVRVTYCSGRRMSGVLFHHTVLSIRVPLHALLAVSALLAGPIGLHFLRTHRFIQREAEEGRTLFYSQTYCCPWGPNLTHTQLINKGFAWASYTQLGHFTYTNTHSQEIVCCEWFMNWPYPVLSIKLSLRETVFV